MVLRGDLKSLNLANVLQDLAQNSQTGTLALRVAERQRYLWFDKGVLRLVGLGFGHGPSVPNGLMAMGRITHADLGAPGKRTGEGALLRTLQKKGTISEADIKAALQEQMNELVCDAFLWSDAEFEFTEGDPDEESYDVRQLDWDARMPCDPIIMEALRRIDEWAEIKKVVISAEEIFEPVSPPPEGSDAVTQRIYSMLDGERRLKDILQQTHLAQFAVFKTAAMLLRSGSIRTLSMADARTKAQAHADAGRWDEALRLVGYGLEHERHSPDLRRLAGRAFEEVGKPEEAAKEYRILLSEMSEMGQKQEAIEICRKVLSLAPRDTFTHEKLFQLQLDVGNAKEALAQGEALAAALKRSGMPDRARDVYERLVAKFSDNEEIIEQLAEIARQLGDKKEAIALYRKLFDKAVARGDEEIVVQRSRTLLRLDPSLEDVAKQRLEVETGIYRRNRSRKQKTKWIAIGAGVLAIAGFLMVREFRARSILKDARSEQRDLIQKHEFGQSVKLYNKVVARVAWTFIADDARGEREDLERRFVEQEYPRAVKLDEGERIPEALAVVDAVLELAQNPDARSRGQELQRKFWDHKGRVENAFLERALKVAAAAKAGKPEALTEIQELAHPLAVPALRALMEDPLPGIRKAVIPVLAKIGSDEALGILVGMMARDDAAADVRAEAEAQLKLVSGADLGSKASDWEGWLLRRGQRPIQGLVLSGKDRYAINERIVIEWRIVNLGTVTAEFTLPAEFGPTFRIVDANGRPLKMVDRVRPGEDRPVRLKPGEYVGGEIPIKDLAEGTELPGMYRVSWASRVKWGAGMVDLSALPVTLDVLPR